MFFVYDFISHRGSNTWVGWNRINLLKIDLKQKQTNVRLSVTDEIINSNSKNIDYNVKKEAV